MPSTTTHTIHVDGIGSVPTTVTDSGDGHPFLLLHGGAGPLSVAGFAGLLAGDGQARVITPVHPGFGGTPRPDALDTPRGLAALYTALAEELDLTDVTVIGNSVGGWIAAEMAILGSPRISGVLLVDAVGIDAPEFPVVDFFSLTLGQVAEYSYHNPDAFRIDPSTMSPEQQAAMAGNRAALATYGGTGMTDPSLAGRLAEVTVPTLVVWGDSDRIVLPDYGRLFAAAIPGARFELLPETGHVPQVESPQRLLRVVADFAHATGPVT